MPTQELERVRRLVVADMEDLWMRAAAACDALAEGEGATAVAAGAATLALAAAQLRSVHEQVAAECDAIGETQIRARSEGIKGCRPAVVEGDRMPQARTLACPVSDCAAGVLVLLH